MLFYSNRFLKGFFFLLVFANTADYLRSVGHRFILIACMFTVRRSNMIESHHTFLYVLIHINGTL